MVVVVAMVVMIGVLVMVVILVVVMVLLGMVVVRAIYFWKSGSKSDRHLRNIMHLTDIFS